MNSCDGSCNTIEDPLGSKICLFNKIEEINLEVLNTVKRIIESKKLIKHISCVDLSLMVENLTQDKNVTKISVSVNVKKKKNIAHVKKITPGILVPVLASVIRILTLVNN